jgi:hypothetical protein
VWISWYLEGYSSTTLPPAITFSALTLVEINLKIHYFITKLQKKRKKKGKHTENKNEK